MAEQVEHDLRTGAKAAAAAAAVAAAAGVARALAAHAHEASQQDEEEAETVAEPEAVSKPEARDEYEEPEKPEEPEEHEPVQGIGVGRVRAMTDRARSILDELSSVEPESVSAVERTRDGWRITLEAVELRRVPDSTDILATYEVELDGEGELVRYARCRRYSRSQNDDGRTG
jgi:hypothetical protein